MPFSFHFVRLRSFSECRVLQEFFFVAVRLRSFDDVPLLLDPKLRHFFIGSNNGSSHSCCEVSKMGAKAKKSLKKKLTKASQLAAARRAKEQSSDFMPLEGVQATKLPEEEEENKATVLYIGHIPHGFYEEQMEGFFKQFGKVKRLRIARNRKTGKSKHYGFLEFENPAVAKVVADEIHNYLLFEHNLQIDLIPSEKIHPKLWKGVGKTHIPHRWIEMERKRHNKERNTKEYQSLVQGILKRDAKRRKRIKDAGIEYECPGFVGNIQTANKKIKFAEEEEEE